MEIADIQHTLPSWTVGLLSVSDAHQFRLKFLLYSVNVLVWPCALVSSRPRSRSTTSDVGQTLSECLLFVLHH